MSSLRQMKKEMAKYLKEADARKDAAEAVEARVKRERDEVRASALPAAERALPAEVPVPRGYFTPAQRPVVRLPGQPAAAMPPREEAPRHRSPRPHVPATSREEAWERGFDPSTMPAPMIPQQRPIRVRIVEDGTERPCDDFWLRASCHRGIHCRFSHVNGPCSEREMATIQQELERGIGRSRWRAYYNYRDQSGMRDGIDRELRHRRSERRFRRRDQHS